MDLLSGKGLRNRKNFEEILMKKRNCKQNLRKLDLWLGIYLIFKY